MQTPFNIRNLESAEPWGYVRIIDDPFDFFRLRDPRLWHPVLGLREGDNFEYFQELETYFEVLDTELNSVGFVRILNEEETVSLHGSIFRNPSVAFKAWHYIITFFFNYSNLAVLRSRVTTDNPKALSFLLNSGFHISFIQKIQEISVIHLELKNEAFTHSILQHLHLSMPYQKIRRSPLLNQSIREALDNLPQDLLNRNLRYFTENARLIYDVNLLVFCLFQTHPNYHEITVCFFNEDQVLTRDPHYKEVYSYYIFKELCFVLSGLIQHRFLLQVSKTRYNLAPVLHRFKYTGSNDQFLYFE